MCSLQSGGFAAGGRLRDAGLDFDQPPTGPNRLAQFQQCSNSVPTITQPNPSHSHEKLGSKALDSARHLLEHISTQKLGRLKHIHGHALLLHQVRA